MDELLEPRKFDPSNPQKQRANINEALVRYNSITGKNPYVACVASAAAPNEESPLSQPTSAENGYQPTLFHNQQIWVLPNATNRVHPALRSPDANEKPVSDRTPLKQFVYDRSGGGGGGTTLLSPGHKRTQSQPLSPSPRLSEVRSPAKERFGFSKAFSDTNFFAKADANQQRMNRRVPPAKLNLPPSSSAKLPQLEAINEQDDFAMNYKVQVRENPGSDDQITRSPLKRLFGEGGILGRSTSAKDLPDPRYKKKGLALWGGKARQRLEEIGKDFTEKFAASGDFATRRSSAAGLATSTFPVTLSPYVQGDFYMQLELLLNIEANNFLMREFQAGRISVQSVRTAVERWKNKGRPQVLGFRFDNATQRELVGANTETVHFAGVNAFTRGKVLSVLAGWKVLAKEMGVRTFCQPDSAVKKHLHDAEKVLELIDASADSMLAFQEMRGRIVTEIYSKEKAENERKNLHGVERPWPCPGLV